MACHIGKQTEGGVDTSGGDMTLLCPPPLPEQKSNEATELGCVGPEQPTQPLTPAPLAPPKAEGDREGEGGLGAAWSGSSQRNVLLMPPKGRGLQQPEQHPHKHHQEQQQQEGQEQQQLGQPEEPQQRQEHEQQGQDQGQQQHDESAGLVEVLWKDYEEEGSYWFPAECLRLRSERCQIGDCEAIRVGMRVVAWACHPEKDDRIADRAHYDAVVRAIRRKPHRRSTRTQCTCYFTLQLFHYQHPGPEGPLPSPRLHPSPVCVTGVTSLCFLLRPRLPLLHILHAAATASAPPGVHREPVGRAVPRKLS